MRAFERAQPWLGTLVRVRAWSGTEAAAQRAITKALEEVQTVHRLMSFHAPDSDVSRMNRRAVKEPVTVDVLTLEVMREALTLAASSDGCFDVSAGGTLAASGYLPAGRHDTPRPGTWRDIEIVDGHRIAFHRPLWIDLGGIAKGYAVDRAVRCLQRDGVVQGSVNAGGDLRVFGTYPERIALRVDHGCSVPAVIEVKQGSVASSNGFLRRQRYEGRTWGPHIDGTSRLPSRTDRFACVLAPTCMLADAMTKVVLALGSGSCGLLRRYGAAAHLHEPEAGWSHLNPECVA